MKWKLFKLLSTGLFLGLTVPTIIFASPISETASISATPSNSVAMNSAEPTADMSADTTALPYEVTVITRYLDGSHPEHTDTYQVGHGNAFLETFEVADGYDLISSLFRSQPIFDVDMDTKTVGITRVERDYTIVLEFDRAQYKVNLKTKYADNAFPETSMTFWISHGDGGSHTYQIADGYQIANLDQLPQGVSVDEDARKITIYNVTQSHDIVLLFDKNQCEVVVTVIYEDGAFEDHISTYSVPRGAPFDTVFSIHDGYTFSKASFNILGVSIDKNHIISISEVTGPVQITIWAN